MVITDDYISALLLGEDIFSQINMADGGPAFDLTTPTQ